MLSQTSCVKTEATILPSWVKITVSSNQKGQTGSNRLALTDEGKLSQADIIQIKDNLRTENRRRTMKQRKKNKETLQALLETAITYYARRTWSFEQRYNRKACGHS